MKSQTSNIRKSLLGNIYSILKVILFLGLHFGFVLQATDGNQTTKTNSLVCSTCEGNGKWITGRYYNLCWILTWGFRMKSLKAFRHIISSYICWLSGIIYLRGVIGLNNHLFLSHLANYVLIRWLTQKLDISDCNVVHQDGSKRQIIGLFTLFLNYSLRRKEPLNDEASLLDTVFITGVFQSMIYILYLGWVWLAVFEFSNTHLCMLLSCYRQK